MKKITFLFILLAVSLGHSQTDVIENFDGATLPTFAPDNGECTTIGMAVSTAQAASGANSFEIIALAAGNPWQGAQLILQGDGIDLTTELTVNVDVYSTVPAGILAKATDGTGPDAASLGTHTGTGWETITYEFSDGADGTTTANGIYSVIRFYPLFGTGATSYAGQGTTPCVSDAPITIYVDNVVGTAVLSTESLSKISFKTYPNPTRNSWNIKAQNVEMTSISVFDVLGKNVLSISPKATEATIDGTRLRSGLYFAEIKTVSGTETIRLVKR